MTGVTVSIKAHGEAQARRLLDRAAPASDELHEAVDAALHRRSTDRAVHAAALWLAYSTGSDLDLDRSQAKRWVLGLDELIDSGHLDAASYVVPRLRAAFPQMPYLEYMALVFRRLPAVVGHGREQFVDDRDSDVQVVAMPGAGTVVLAFCGIGHRLGLSLSLMDRWFARFDCHVVYLRDRERIGFTGGIPSLGPDLATTIEGLRSLVRGLGARRVVCMGNSAGGSAALRYALSLGAERVLALAPITGGQGFVQKLALNTPPGGVMPWTDLVPLYRDGADVGVRILYGTENEGDREQSLRMAGLPNVWVEGVAEWDSHHLVGGLVRAGKLMGLLDWLTAADDVVDG